MIRTGLGRASLITAGIATTGMGAFHFLLPYLFGWARFTDPLPAEIRWALFAMNAFLSLLLSATITPPPPLLRTSFARFKGRLRRHIPSQRPRSGHEDLLGSGGVLGQVLGPFRRPSFQLPKPCRTNSMPPRRTLCSCTGTFTIGTF